MKELDKLRTEMVKSKDSSRGVSVIELLIVIAISAVILLALLSLYTASQKYFINQSAKADTIEDSRYPLAWLSRDIRESAQLVTNHGAYSSSAQSLVIQIPSINETGEVIENLYDYIIYRLNPNFPNKLERIVDADESSSRKDRTRVLADEVHLFELGIFKSDGTAASTYDETSIVSIALTSRKKKLGAKDNFFEKATTWVKLRNRT